MTIGNTWRIPESHHQSAQCELTTEQSYAVISVPAKWSQFRELNRYLELTAHGYPNSLRGDSDPTQWMSTTISRLQPPEFFWISHDSKTDFELYCTDTHVLN